MSAALATGAAIVGALAAASSVGVVPLANYSIPSASMRPTLLPGDMVMADTLKGLCGLTHPTPGDIVIYRKSGTQPYVARVVAGPGQTVAMHQSRLVIDGHPVATKVVGAAPGDYYGVAKIVRETLPNGASYLTLDTSSDGQLDEVPVTRVPAKSWYLMGDNRDNAADSRVPAEIGGAGFVPETNICGIANLVIFSKDKSHVGRKP